MEPDLREIKQAVWQLQKLLIEQEKRSAEIQRHVRDIHFLCWALMVAAAIGSAIQLFK